MVVEREGREEHEVRADFCLGVCAALRRDGALHGRTGDTSRHDSDLDGGIGAGRLRPLRRPRSDFASARFLERVNGDTVTLLECTARTDAGDERRVCMAARSIRENPGSGKIKMFEHASKDAGLFVLGGGDALCW